MKRFFTTTKILVYVIIALIALNVATLATIYVHRHHDRSDHFHERFIKGDRDKKMDFIREKLALETSQIPEYEKAHTEFLEKGKMLMDSMFIVRKKMFESMAMPKPDTTQIMALTNNLGMLHIEMKKNTIQFYFNLRKICTPTQLDTLKNIFTRMLEYEGGRMHPQHGSQRPEPPQRPACPSAGRPE